MQKRHLVCLAFLGFFLASLGCAGGNAQVPAKVSGSISYNGQPIKGGSLAFVTADGVSYGGSIASDGTYSATDLPVGEMVVVVDTEGNNPAKKGAQGGDAGRRNAVQQQQPPPGMGGAPEPSTYYIKIPSKYSNAKTSPLAIKLSAGRNVHNLELKD
jgi:hypothetical protein